MKRHILLLLALGAGALFAAPPAWWSDSPTRIFPPAPTPLPNNAGPVNQAQLKNVAKKAALYLHNTLLEGEGTGISGMVAGLQNNPATALQPVMRSKFGI
jgi:hypothetical protein